MLAALTLVSDLPAIPLRFWAFAGFVAVVLALLALDLGVLHRRAHVVRTGEALLWTGIWLTLSLLFAAVVYAGYEWDWLGLGNTGTPGRQATVQYLSGYLIEKSLSLDNIFVIATIFAYFRVPPENQHRVLFWGIIGVVVMRGLMIALGTALFDAFDWVAYVFGAMLLFSAAKMLSLRTDTIRVESNFVVRGVRRPVPVSSAYVGNRFLTRVGGRLTATPLLVALLAVESADVIFALDSIPAVLAVTRDPFIVFTSNIFAVLGLRSLYFALAAIIARFRYLKVSLAFVLAYVGAKMTLTHHLDIDPILSLAVIAAILGIGVIASIADDRRGRTAEEPFLGPEVERAARMTLRHARRLVVLTIGSTIILIGVVMLVTPGPGFLVAAAGLAILATEFVWARRLLRRCRLGAHELTRRADRAFGLRNLLRLPRRADRKPSAPPQPTTGLHGAAGGDRDDEYRAAS